MKGLIQAVGVEETLYLFHPHIGATLDVLKSQLYDSVGIVKLLGAHAGGTRVVLDLAATAFRRVFYLPDPFRIVIDVSTKWVDGRQVGDLGPGVDEVAGWLTPNPGGVGPMTRAMLIKNTFDAEVRRRG